MVNKGKAPETHNAFGAPSDWTSKLLAAYDAGHRVDEAETYFEVPSSHFLARPGGSSSFASASATGTSSSSAVLSGDVGRGSGGSSGDGLSFVTVQEHAEHMQSSQEEIKSNTSISNEEALDGSHFLSALPSSLTNLAALHAHPAANLFGGHQQPRPHMPDTTTLAAADFDIDVRSGFLPPEEPVKRLQGIEEELWESALDRAQQLPLRIGGGGTSVGHAERWQAYEWRKNIRQMLVLHPSPQILSDIRFARRAHLVLSFLAHFYIHSQPASALFDNSLERDVGQDYLDERLGKFSGIVPASIAVPWVSISRIIDIPPVLTYATTVMWNWHLRDVDRGFKDENLEMSTTFSGTESERHFYMTSLLTEVHGVEALTLMRRTLDEAFVGDTLAIRRIRHYLHKLANVIDLLRQIIHDVRDGCDPKTFYWGIRPWFNGCDSYVDKATGEKGWIFEGVEEFGGRRMLFLGPSAGQSSLIHAIDVFLGVDHSVRQRRASASQRENGTFMERMQVYMPGHHRNFLTHLRNISFVDEEEEALSDASGDMNVDEEEEPSDDEMEQRPKRERHPIRALLQLSEEQQIDESKAGIARRAAVDRLREAYNEALTSLKHMRDEHMRIASHYIIAQMRTAPPPEFAVLNETLTTTTSSAASSTPSKGDGEDPSEGSAKGTGGTDLVSFLRACRSNTVNTIMPNGPR